MIYRQSVLFYNTLKSIKNACRQISSSTLIAENQIIFSEHSVVSILSSQAVHLKGIKSSQGYRTVNERKNLKVQSLYHFTLDNLSQLFTMHREFVLIFRTIYLQ